MNTITSIWQELFDYWQTNECENIKCIGATKEQLAELGQEIKLKIPNELKESLTCCNSYPEDWSNIKSGCLFLGNCSILKDTKNIIETYKDGLVFGYVENPNWIPIYDWNGDVLIFMSVEDNSIIYTDMEFGVKKTIFKSYTDFLEHVKSAILSKGSVSYEDFDF